jgi:hypothetical protein
MSDWLFDTHSAPKLVLADFTTAPCEMTISFVDTTDVIVELQDSHQHLKLTLTLDAVLEICKAQLTMLQGGCYGE